MDNIGLTVRFTEEYKSTVFYTWYNLGKPTATRLQKALDPDPSSGEIPASTTLHKWIKEFQERADFLDLQIQEELENRIIKEKVEMLRRHADLGQKMQTMAMDYLKRVEENKEDLKVPNAIRLLVEGIRIEHESRGIPSALEKMINKSDEDLLKEIESIMTRAELIPSDVTDS